MPAWRTVYGWMASDKGFAARIAHARDVGFDAIGEEALEIADDGTNDWIERENERTGRTETVLDNEHVQRSKLRIETRLKLLAKWCPKRYGEKLTTELTGPDGGPLQIEESVKATRLAAILAAASKRKDNPDDCSDLV